MEKSETVFWPWRRRSSSCPASGPVAEQVEHALHLRHELPRRSQAQPVGVPRRCPPASRSPGQLGDDVRHTRGVGGEGLGLKLEDELAL